MFSFLRKKDNIAFPIGELLEVDMHSHVLPGIDDGAPDVDTALHLVQGLSQIGFRAAIATPHVTADSYPNTPGTISDAHRQLQATQDAATPVIRFAAEYMLDEGIRPLIADRALLTLGDTDYVLVETPFLHRPQQLERWIFELQTAGYRPVLAHPERYHYLFKKPVDYADLKERGCAFQVNLLSLVGYYGKPEKAAAHWLLAADMIDFLGTDLHHDRHLQNLLSFSTDQRTVKILESKTFLNSTLTGANKKI